jgi:hypothetical protein
MICVYFAMRKDDKKKSNNIKKKQKPHKLSRYDSSAKNLPDIFYLLSN